MFNFRIVKLSTHLISSFCILFFAFMGTTHSQVLYSASETNVNDAAFGFNGSYGGQGSYSNDTVSYDLNFTSDYSSALINNITLTAAPETITQTASFADGIGNPLLPVTTTYTYTVTLSPSGYSPTGTVSPGVGGYHLIVPNGNLYSGTITYTGTYNISGGGQTASGNFNDTYNTTQWSNLPLISTSTSSPIITFAETAPNYALALSSVAYNFYPGDIYAGNLFSGTVDGVTISATPSYFQFEGSAVPVVVELPEPVIWNLFFSGLVLLAVGRFCVSRLRV